MSTTVQTQQPNRLDPQLGTGAQESPSGDEEQSHGLAPYAVVCMGALTSPVLVSLMAVRFRNHPAGAGWDGLRPGLLRQDAARGGSTVTLLWKSTSLASLLELAEQRPAPEPPGA